VIDLQQYEPDNHFCWVLEFTLNRPALGKMTPTRGFLGGSVPYPGSPIEKFRTFKLVAAPNALLCASVLHGKAGNRWESTLWWASVDSWAR